jgi:hypothetical protein
MGIFDLGKDRKAPSLGANHQDLANDILKWSTGNCSKEELKKKHEKLLGWMDGDSR